MPQEPSGSGADKRRATRVGAPKVVVRVPSADRFRSHYLRDLSEGGLFIRAEKMIPLGTELLLELYPPGESDPLTLPSRVVRNVEPANATSSQPPGVAVSFVGLSPEQQLRLKKLIEQYGKELPDAGDENNPLDKVQRMVAELEEARGHVSSLATELAEARGELEGYAEQVRQLEADEAAARASAEEAVAAKEELEAEVEKLRAENEALQTQADQGEKRAAEVTAMRSKVAESQKELEAAKARERDLGKLLSGVGGKAAGIKPRAAAAAIAAPVRDHEEVIVVDSAGVHPEDEPIELTPKLAKKKAAKPEPARSGLDGSIDLAFPSNDDVLPALKQASLDVSPKAAGLDVSIDEDIALDDEPLAAPAPPPKPAAKPASKPAPKGPPLKVPSDDLDSFLSGDEEGEDKDGGEAVHLDDGLEIEESPAHSEDDELAGGPAGFVLQTSIVDGRVGYPQFAKKLKVTTRLMPNDALNGRKPGSVDEALLSELIAAAPTFGTLMNQIGGQLKEERLKQLLYELYARALIDLRDY